jgi:hypothetical protein
MRAFEFNLNTFFSKKVKHVKTTTKHGISIYLILIFFSFFGLKEHIYLTQVPC